MCVSKERAEHTRKTHEQFLQELADVNPNIEILSKYITSDHKVKCKCLIDSNEWYAKPHALLQGHGCPICAKTNQNWRTEQQFIEELHNKYPDITPMSKFTKVNNKVTFLCNTCGYQWSAVPNTMLNSRNSRGCPKCAGKAKLTEQDIIDRLNGRNSKIQYIGGFSKTQEHAKFRCTICHYEWSTIVSSVLRGTGCPKCNVSQGGLKIEETLNKLGVAYEMEYRFENCRDKRTLPFDFYIESHNTCIEYDGEQHFKPVRFDKHDKRGTPSERFEQLQRRDSIKSNFCKNNGIRLIRIPYTDFNSIDEILNKYFS